MELPLVVFLILGVINTGISSENLVTRTLKWTSYEDFLASNWTLFYYENKVNTWSKASDISPRLADLDSNFSGNVWGFTGTFFHWYSVYRFYDRYIPDLCNLQNVTLGIKYYHEISTWSTEFNRTHRIYPVLGDESTVHLPQPNNSRVEWNDVAINIDLEALQSPNLTNINIWLEMSVQDLILYDEISLTFTEKQTNFSCNEKPDGIYEDEKDFQSLGKCDAGQAFAQC